MQPPRTSASQVPSVLAAVIGTGLLALSGVATRHGALWLPEYVGPKALIYMAAFYGVAACVALAISWLVPMTRLAFSAVSAALALLIHTFFFLSFGMLLATEDEFAERLQVFWFLAVSIGLCGLATWLLSIAAAKLLRGHNRVA